MRASTKRILSIALSGIFFIGTLVIYTNFIKPEMKNIDERRSIVVSKENLFSNQFAAVQQVQKLIGEFQDIAGLQDSVSLAIPFRENTTQILNQVRVIAANNQTAIDSFSIKPLAFSPSRQPLAKRLGTLDVNLSLKGTYESLKGFLKFLETNARIANIAKVHLAPFGSSISGTVQDIYSMSLGVEMYYQEQ